MHDILIQEKIRTKIIEIRGQRVILDRDLAKLYGVETRALNQSVKRNNERFPDDFMFQLTKDEFDNLKYQNGTSKRGGRRYIPYVFTEQGIAMMSSVLRSEKAIEINIAIMRVFVMVARIIDSSKTLSEKIEDIEKKQESYKNKTNKNIKEIFNVINYLTERKEKDNKNKIGFEYKK